MASKLLRVCSLLTAAIFAYTASIQFHDPDWYLWLPLYSFACLVNLADPTSSEKSRKTMGKMVLWLGLVVFFKGSYVGDYGCCCGGTLVQRQEIAGFWSLDSMKERETREKLVSSMVLHHDQAASLL